MATSFSRTTRSLTNDTSRYAMVAWLTGGLLLTGWMLWFFLASITVYEISTNARLEVNSSARPVAALAAGKIAAITMTLGQAVQSGDVVAELDAANEKIRLNEEQSRLQSLPPQIAALQKEITALEQAKIRDHQAGLAATSGARSRYNEARTALEFARDNERRLAELGNSGRVPVIEVLRVHAEAQKLSAAKDALATDIQRLEMDAETRVNQKQAAIENLKRELARLNGEIETIQLTIARLKLDIEKHVIRAPVSGRIGDVAPLQAGAYVRQGDKLGTVVPAGGMKIVADFYPAAVVGKIHPGQFSRMRLDGFPWAQYGAIRARVSRVASEVRDNRIRVEFIPEPATNPPILLQHGLPGAIEVNIEQVSPAVLILRASGQLLSNAGNKAAHG